MQEAGRTTPLTSSEIEEIFASAPRTSKQRAYWLDSDGKYHRDGDLPAHVWANGDQNWYRHGKNHRDGDLPAIVYADGEQIWVQHGAVRRDNNLPAVIHPDGAMVWYENGEKTGDQDNPPPGAVFPGQQTKSARKK